MPSDSFINRDISWLSFNDLVLIEASKPAVPLLERLKFIAIFSSNIDEFYRIRMPVLRVIHKMKNAKKKTRRFVSENEDVYEKANQITLRQSQFFGEILIKEIIPGLKKHRFQIIYNEAIPREIASNVGDYFFNTIAAFLEITFIQKLTGFVPKSNKLYIAVTLTAKDKREDVAMVYIPSDKISRFFSVENDGVNYVIFIDDIIKLHLPVLFPESKITGAYSIKITRDAELHLANEFQGNLVEKIEKQLAKRDFGMATRFLYSPGMPHRILESITKRCSLSSASMIEGGNYHNLSDFANLPHIDPSLLYPDFRGLDHSIDPDGSTLFHEILKKDILIHTPYHNYNCILRFFNEGAIMQEVEEIFVTLYRIAHDSKIAHALISSALNGKKVTVFVEVKARFDEQNNIMWAKKMKAAGIHIIYSIPLLKVHAKVGLIKMRKNGKKVSLGLLATGNFNEITAGFYTDHILLTANKNMLAELESLFRFLKNHKKPRNENEIIFHHLLIARFNLQKHFLALVENEIANARKGLPAGIIIKLNNLEEEVMISKLYEASCAGVKINLLVRSICRLRPGIKGMSENITVRRIVGRFLEHGRVFIFCNNNRDLVYLGSSDWMNRNLYQRIEVCFPVYDHSLQQEIKDIISIQLDDTVSAVAVDKDAKNISLTIKGKEIESQKEIFKYLENKNNLEN
jgi:polyphosphate kinase